MTDKKSSGGRQEDDGDRESNGDRKAPGDMQGVSVWEASDREDQKEALFASDDENACAEVPAKWACHNGVPGCLHAQWLCDACGRQALDQMVEAGKQDIYPIVAINLSRPHVWAAGRHLHQDLFYADRIDDADFVVPTAAAHMLDPDVLAGLMRWAVDEPMVDLHDVCLSEVGSPRGWMPLVGSHDVCVTQGSWRRERKRTRVAMVCCDRRNPIWGAVMIVDFGQSQFSMAWHGIEDDIDGLLRRWKRHPLRAQEPRFARNWVEWAGEVYIDVVERSLDIGYLAKKKRQEQRRKELWAALLLDGSGWIDSDDGWSDDDDRRNADGGDE